MASRDVVNRYKSNNTGVEGKFCDILSLEKTSACLRPTESCARCPVAIWFVKGSVGSGMDLDTAIRMAKERAS